ncbi:hypothetical protein WOLCODRAFT_165435 [Wolfiporia cocos MD-104 SS10]|uniref:Uncharacterized protein n=1 Tax=Wolfiporia cocos (strain MD-104) TaxID=742152 RepID=A0A2H3JRQ6_WOLCO|nr:hypothetical protein WOLCODRAFT_165435 [Wolfiporia cocos MD-104 SS10]
MSSKVLWYWLVENHAICAGLVHVPRTFLAEFLLAALIVFTVQCYYIMLIWRLLEDRWCRKPLAIIALLLATMSFGAAIAVIYRATTDTTLAVTIPAVIIPACIQTAAAVVADIYIALFLCCILYGQRTGPGKLNVRHHLRDRIMADVDSDISLPMEFLSTRSRLQEWAGASSNESGS